MCTPNVYDLQGGMMAPFWALTVHKINQNGSPFGCPAWRTYTVDTIVPSTVQHMLKKIHPWKDT